MESEYSWIPDWKNAVKTRKEKTAEWLADCPTDGKGTIESPIPWGRFRHAHMWTEDSYAIETRGDKLEDYIVMAHLYGINFLWKDNNIYPKSFFLSPNKKILLLQQTPLTVVQQPKR